MARESHGVDDGRAHPGICRVDQVGVNAPGRPTMITFLLATRAARSIFSGGKPKSRVSLGRLLPTSLEVEEPPKGPPVKHVDSLEEPPSTEDVEMMVEERLVKKGR